MSYQIHPVRMNQSAAHPVQPRRHALVDLGIDLVWRFQLDSLQSPLLASGALGQKTASLHNLSCCECSNGCLFVYAISGVKSKHEHQGLTSWDHKHPTWGEIKLGFMDNDVDDSFYEVEDLQQLSDNE